MRWAPRRRGFHRLPFPPHTHKESAKKWLESQLKQRGTVKCSLRTVEHSVAAMSDDTGEGTKARLSIRVGNSRIDLEGTEQVVTAELLKLRGDEQWSAALEKDT